MLSRSVSVLALLLTACAAWETATPAYAPPPADSPAPSHYAPPPPQDPQPEPTPEPTPEPDPKSTPIALSPVTKLQVAIASVQLLEDCPDPAPEPAQAPVVDAPAAPITPSADESRAEPAARSSMKRPGGDYRRMCTQSTVQLSVQADGVQPFRIVSVRVLAANGKQAVGSTTLRAPTTWDDATGTYDAWQEHTAAGKDLKVSYKMGELAFTPAADKLSGDKFNTFGGPFILELEVAVGGKRRTVRSPEFTREPPHVMVT